MMHDIFISYSTLDQVQAETVRDILEKNGIPCWMAPRDIPGGSNYTREIPVAIRSCQVFVLILSENSQNSHWVLKELDAAVNCGKVILPFMLEDCHLNDEFNFLLTGAQRYAAYQKKAEALEALISRIRAITGGQSGESIPEPVVPVPAPEKAPVKESTYLGIAKCPSCGSSELEELTKKVGRYTFAEKLWVLLPPVLVVAGALAGLLIASTIMAFLSNYKLFDTVMLICVAVCAIAGGVGGSIASKEWIQRQRVRKHLHRHPFRCTECKKEFLLEKN